MYAKMNLIFALLTMLGIALAQGVTQSIAPKGSYPSGCNKNFDGDMEVTVITLDTLAKRSVMLPQRRAQCSGTGILVMTLQDGVLKDAQGRTGYIAANYQFQFDAPPQQGALTTAGYCLFSNQTLALGPTTTFYRCESGNFYNLYDRKYASYCDPVQILAMPCGGAAAAAGGIPDGTVQGSVVGTKIVQTTVVRPLADGQPEIFVTNAPVPLCQIDDGQPQDHPTPCPFVGGLPTAAPPISQISDGQIQVAAPGPANAGSAEATPTYPTVEATAPAAKPAGNNTLGVAQPKPTQFGTSDGNHIVGSLIAIFAGVLGLVAIL